MRAEHPADSTSLDQRSRLRRASTDAMLRGLNTLGLLLLPVLYLQGRYVRHVTPRLPAAESDSGVVGSDDARLELLVLGESTAAGVGARRHDRALAGQTARALSDRLGRPVFWRALGENGHTAESARRELLPRLGVCHADVVVLALGVNDTLAIHGPRRWTADLERLIYAVQARTKPSLVLLSAVPPLHRFPALPSPLRQVLGLRSLALDGAARRLAARLPGVRHVAFDYDGDAGLFCRDGFHPSAAGYERWGRRLAEAVDPREVPPLNDGAPEAGATAC